MECVERARMIPRGKEMKGENLGISGVGSYLIATDQLERGALAGLLVIVDEDTPRRVYGEKMAWVCCFSS